MTRAAAGGGGQRLSDVHGYADTYMLPYSFSLPFSLSLSVSASLFLFVVVVIVTVAALGGVSIFMCA